MKEAEANAQVLLPGGTRMRLLKRALLAAMRVYTRYQALFNYNLVQYARKLDSKVNYLSNRLERQLGHDTRSLKSLKLVQNRLIFNVDRLQQRQHDLQERTEALEQLGLEWGTQRQALAEAHLVERVAKLEKALRLVTETSCEAPVPVIASTPPPAFDYVSFENRFRGEEQAIRGRMAAYLPHLSGCRTVLDVACGRGELLELLKAAGIAASGVDRDPGMVAECVKKGLEVTRADALQFLRDRRRSWDGIVVCQMVEHLETADLLDLLSLCYERLSPGGVFIVETPNPTCLMVLGGSYVMDPTHVRPWHFASLAFLLSQAGFVKVTPEFKTLFPISERLPEVAGAESEIEKTFNAAMRRLNDVLFSHQDYALIAQKP